MALIPCPECSKQVSTKATMCPNCGYPLQQSNVQEALQPFMSKTGSANEPLGELSDQLVRKVSELGGYLYGDRYDCLEVHFREERIMFGEIVKLCANHVRTVKLAGYRQLFGMEMVWTDGHVELLVQFNKLSSLTLHGGDAKHVTDETLLHISRISTLQTIDMGEMFKPACEKFTLTGFKMLTRLPKLDMLVFPKYIDSRDMMIADLRRSIPNTIIR